MRREKTQNVADGFSRRRTKDTQKRWFRKRNIAGFGLLFLGLATIFGLPAALSNRQFVLQIINRYSGLSPIRVELDSITIGWLTPLKISGLKLIDQQGDEIVKLGALDSELGLWRLAMNRSDLGTITFSQLQMVIDVQPGTTSLEEAIKPLIGSSAGPSQPSDPMTPSTTVLPTGRIRISDATFVARDSVDLSSWQLSISEADIPLPTADQSIPPITLVGSIQQLASQIAGSTGAVHPANDPVTAGQFTIRTQPIEGSQPQASNSFPAMRMTIATSQMPIRWASLLQRRFGNLSFEQLAGSATIDADITMLDSSNIIAKLATAQIDNLQVDSNALLGPAGASLQRIKLSGTVSIDKNRMLAENAILESDAGAIGIAASLPLQMTFPTATQPWIADSQWNVQGEVDLARLVRVAPDLIPMQQGSQLTAGRAILSSIQTLEADLRPKGVHRIELGNLVASIAGTKVTWDNALKASATIEPDAYGNAAIAAECESEFCDIRADGDLNAGRLTAKFDLDKLHERISQWFAIPMVQQMSGVANAEVKWNQENQNRLVASGELKTTPMKIALSNGSLNEPAWNGAFEAIGTKDRGSLIQIDRATLTLDSESERLQAELHEPLSLVAVAPGSAKLPPGAMSIDVAGDLSNILRRAEMLSGMDLGIDFQGTCRLIAQGAIDTSHLELSSAKLNAKSVVLGNESFTWNESAIEGTFSGRFDSADIARLQVDNLQLQSSSFAVSARDSATKDGNGRLGKAAFRVDPKQMMSAMGSSTSDANNFEADVTGTADWLINPASDIRWQTVIDAKDIKIYQPHSNTKSGTANQSQLVSHQQADRELIWEEPIGKATCNGIYNLKSGVLTFPETNIQTTWMAYGGQATYVSSSQESKATANGQVTYDAAVVAEKIQPWTGKYLTIQGQRTEPVEITWTSNSTSRSWTDSLQAKTQLGWDSANIVGVDIGKADVPFEIKDGVFRSKAEIPVSKGALRWDLGGDLAKLPMVITQSQEMVMENVAITPQMCQGWLKYVAPLLADVTSVQGQLSLQIDRAEFVPTDTYKQTIVGQLHIEDASVGPGPLADQLLAIVQQVRALRKGMLGDNSNSNDSWLKMPVQNIDFEVVDGRVSHKNLEIRAGDIVIHTEGSVSINGQLALSANIPIVKEWVEKTPALASLAGQSLKIPVAGTIQKPQVDFAAFTNIGRQLTENAVQGAFTKQFDKGINKILGPLEKQIAPLQQNIQKNLPSIPSLPNIQFPGFGN